jgi:hypothetical protein
MQRYSNLLAILLAALAVALALPAAASAGCPGCEEYTLDIPEDGGGGGGEPAPAPAPAAPVAPTAPTTPTTTVPEATTAPATTVPVAPLEEDKPKPKPEDTDPDPVPDSAAVKPIAADLPAVAASQTRELAGSESDTGGLLPLAFAMVAVAVVAGVIGFRRRGAEPEASESRPG